MDAITLHNVKKVFSEYGSPPVVALRDIDLEIRHGEFLVLIGPSGAGKSTILRIMSGLEKSYEGSVKYDPALQLSDSAFVFQQFGIMPWLTVFQNVEFGLYSREPSQAKRTAIVMEELRQFGLERFAHAHPRELSGGMQQRVGLARAFAVKPKILFMDEPFSELDSFTAEELRKELLRIWQERKITIVLVTHIIEEALELADRVAVLTPRPSTIEKVVQNLLPRPRNKRSPEFYELADTLYRIIRP